MHETLIGAVVLVVGAANLGLIALSACVDPRTGQWRRAGWRAVWREEWRKEWHRAARAMQATPVAASQAVRRTLRTVWAARGVSEAVFIVYTLSWLTLLA